MVAERIDEQMPFVGIATFAAAPHSPEPTADEADVAVLGIPFDLGTTARSGARMGPRSLRETSTLWTWAVNRGPMWDGEVGAYILGGVRIVDCGDVPVVPMMSAERLADEVAPRVRRLVTEGVFPVVLGGDHSVTYPVLRGVAEGRNGAPVHLVHFDTHLDYWEDEGGERYTHASPIIRAHEDGLLSGLTQIGIRGLHTSFDNISLARERGAHIVWCEQARRTPVEELVRHLTPGIDVFITFDIDALDPSIAPGTGTPEPGGFSYYEAKAILRAVCDRVNVVGIDLVEVNPLYDPSASTAIHGCRLLLDAIGAVLPSTEWDDR